VGASAVARLPMVTRKHLGHAAEGGAAFPKATSKERPQFAEKAGADVGGVDVHGSSQPLVDLYARVFEERVMVSDRASDMTKGFLDGNVVALPERSLKGKLTGTGRRMWGPGGSKTGATNGGRAHFASDLSPDKEGEAHVIDRAEKKGLRREI
jgi:hypothetical protein